MDTSLKTVRNSAVVCLAAAFGLSFSSVAAAEGTALAEEDRTFLLRASQAVIASAELARVGEINASTEEVQSIATELAVEHTRAAAAMRELAKIKGFEIASALTPEQRKRIAEFSEKRGETFDKAYLAQVVENHAEAIQIFGDAARKSKDPDLRAFAERSLGEMKDRHLAMGGKPIKVEGSIGLKIARPRPAPAPAKGQKAAIAKTAVKTPIKKVLAEPSVALVNAALDPTAASPSPVRGRADRSALPLATPVGRAAQPVESADVAAAPVPRVVRRGGNPGISGSMAEAEAFPAASLRPQGVRPGRQVLRINARTGEVIGVEYR